MKAWERDKAWSDRYVPAIARAVAPHLIVAAPLEVDATENTDFMVLTARDVRIAARIREYRYLARYPGEFTIRSKRDSGAKTDLEKIVDGWGDWMFYGFAAADGDELAAWRLIDLSALRAHMQRFYRAESKGGTKRDPFVPQRNGDGTHFVAFRVASLPPDVIIASDGFGSRAEAA